MNIKFKIFTNYFVIPCFLFYKNVNYLYNALINYLKSKTYIDIKRQKDYNIYRRVIKNMKRIIKYFFVIFLLFSFIVKANALEVSKNDITIEKGGSDNIELYANVEEEVISVTFTLVYSTYDIPASFNVASGASDTNPNGITHTVVFNEAKSGKILLGTVNISVKNYPTDMVGSVNIHTASAKTSSEEKINLDAQNINIKVGTATEEPKKEEKKEEPKEVDKNLLDKIESKIVKIELKKDVFDYTVNVKKEIDELDLKPIAKSEDTKIDISSQKISELKDGKIVITTKNNDTEQVYNIKVNVKEEDQITIDKDEFKADKSYKGKWIIVSIILIVALIISMLFARKK